MQTFESLAWSGDFLSKHRSTSKRNWTSVNALGLVVGAHFLLLILVYSQRPAVMKELTRRVAEVKLLSSASTTELRPQIDMATQSKTPVNSVKQAAPEPQTKSLSDISKPVVEKTLIPIGLESANIAAKVETKAEIIVPTRVETPQVQIDTKPSVKEVSSIGSEDHIAKEIRIGEYSNNIVEILRMGSSKAVYAMTDLNNQDNKNTFNVEVGDYPDIETAIVNHIIARIRSAYPKEIEWNSKVKGRFVKLSMLTKDHAATEKFLRLEIFGKARDKDYSFWDKSKF